MNFKHTTKVLTLALLASSQLVQAKKTSKKLQPNIVVFMVDDMGWQDTSLPFWNKETYLNKQFHTPNMEKLASEGMMFTQAYACAICSPTRVSLMTGMNAARHRVTNWTLYKDKMNQGSPKGLKIPEWNYNGVGVDQAVSHTAYTPQPLPKVLQDNGYYTIHCGKAHFGAIGTPTEDPRSLGFDVNIAGHAAGGPASYLGSDNFAKPQKKNSIWNIPGLEEFHGKDIFLTEALTQKALQVVTDSVPSQKPFFLYMAHYAVHSPIMGDDRFVQKYIDQGLSPIEAKYASMVEGMDKSLGDIMYYLKKNNLEKNTVILFMSDNGGLSALARGGLAHTHNYPLSSGKGSIREGGIREPMIVKWPQVVKPNTKCDDYVIIEDFFPTILEIAQVKELPNKHQPIDGKSFTPLLEGQKNINNKRPIFWHSPNFWGPSGPGISFYSAIREGDWKLIYYHTNQKFELFNIKEDIGEHYNLACQQKDRTKQLAKKLSDYLREVKAQLPIIAKTGEKVPLPDEIEIIEEP
ncbi:sulfatase [Halosquirtibacter xylanolyticus]|uniref:sulfatase n=1 Tax=Halosquirtibacter xylanolyticus TaxID=3374599 RepID=UPI003748F01A|nr:sulfatase [Prolixibacteraceae bacterium]